MYKRLVLVLVFLGISIGSPLDADLIVDLVYNTSTGNVKIDLDDYSAGILGFELKNSANTFIAPGTATFPAGGVSTDTTAEVSWANLSALTTSPHDLGNIFPSGFNSGTLATYLTTARYSPAPLGSAVTNFDLVVVPEPSACLLLGCICGGILVRFGWKYWRGGERS